MSPSTALVMGLTNLRPAQSQTVHAAKILSDRVSFRLHFRRHTHPSTDTNTGMGIELSLPVNYSSKFLSGLLAEPVRNSVSRVGTRALPATFCISSSVTYRAPLRPSTRLL